MDNTIYTTAKRLTDLLLALVLLLVLSPLMLVCALLLLPQFGTDVLFVQVRSGQYGRRFSIIKFRTMRHAVDANGKLLPDAQRMTAIGKWMRRFHFDELPQLVNVVKGDLSLVGPRPLLPEYNDWYTGRQCLRLMCKPGMTGLAQLKGGNSLAWPHRLEYDSFYAEHASLRLDLRILGETIGYLFSPASGTRIHVSDSLIDFLQQQERQKPLVLHSTELMETAIPVAA